MLQIGRESRAFVIDKSGWPTQVWLDLDDDKDAIEDETYVYGERARSWEGRRDEV